MSLTLSLIFDKVRRFNQSERVIWQLYYNLLYDDTVLLIRRERGVVNKTDEIPPPQPRSLKSYCIII